MSLGGILILVLLVVSLFVFIYLMVITARSWGALQVVLLSFIFIECWVFLVFAGRALDKRLALLKEYSTTSANVEKLEKEVKKLTWGGDNISEDQDAYVPLAGTVRRLAADRGRVWRNVTKLSVEGEKVRIELTPPAAVPAAGAMEDPGAAAAAPAAAAVTDTIPQNMIVYAFSQGVPNAAPAGAPAPTEPASPADSTNGAEPAAEPAPAAAVAGGEASGSQLSVPQIFLGEFRVVESVPGNVTLEPVTPLDPDQRKSRDEEGTWALYETLPQDSHDAFLVKGALPNEQTALGDVDKAALTALFATIPAERRAQVIDAYVRDGQAAAPTDDSANVWQLVEVVKPIQRDVDGGKVNTSEAGYFDSVGRTIDSRLMIGGEQKVTLPEGKQLLMPQSEEVSKLIADGDLKLIRKVYMRPLNSYEQGIAQLRLHRTEIGRLLEMANREADVLKQTYELGQSTKKAYMDLQVKLESDRNKYRQEVALLDKEIQAVSSKVQQRRDQMVQFWKAVHAAHDSGL